jgi:2,5-dioxopentanoate dehydrogenase
MTLHGKIFLGASLSAGSGKTQKPTSPLDSQTLEPGFYQADQSQVDTALDLAHAASTTLRNTPAVRRAEFLEAIAANILALGDALLDRANLETGLPKDRLTGERGRTIGQLKMFADLLREGSWVDARIDTAQPDRKPIPKVDLRRMLVPIGPVVVFGSSNFPLAFSVAGGDSASALAAGCPVIVKAHSAHPGTAEMVAGAVRAAVVSCSLPDGTFSMLHGSGRTIGSALAKHPHTRAIGFTGSREAGRSLFDIASSRPSPIPVFAEMASLNPIFILPGAMQERAAKIAEGLKGSFTLGVGQFCTKPGLVFAVESPDLESFKQTLITAIESATPGTMLHPGICDAFHHGLAAASKTLGVTPLAASKQAASKTQTQAQPIALQTTGENFLKHPQLAEEVFGPFTLLVTVKSVAQLLTLAQSLQGQLTATLHATPKDLASAADLLHTLETKAGRLILNAFPTGVEVCPAMQHGGPYPATTDSRFTSVGTAAIARWVRPVSYQSFPQDLLPDELKDSNPLKIQRILDGKRQ